MKINKATKKCAMNLEPEAEATVIEKKEEKNKLLFFFAAIKKVTLPITPVGL